jgi:hypothetical protein
MTCHTSQTRRLFGDWLQGCVFLRGSSPGRGQVKDGLGGGRRLLRQARAAVGFVHPIIGVQVAAIAWLLHLAGFVCVPISGVQAS